MRAVNLWKLRQPLSRVVLETRRRMRFFVKSVENGSGPEPVDEAARNLSTAINNFSARFSILLHSMVWQEARQDKLGCCLLEIKMETRPKQMGRVP
jgi:hypothetical protein